MKSKTGMTTKIMTNLNQVSFGPAPGCTWDSTRKWRSSRPKIVRMVVSDHGAVAEAVGPPGVATIYVDDWPIKRIYVVEDPLVEITVEEVVNDAPLPRV